jgi:hypothetical protein
MYQWIEDRKSETRKTFGGGEETVTTYSYRQGWADRPVDSGAFKQPQGHANPEMRWKDRSFALSEARMGARRVDLQTMTRMGDGAEVPVEATQEAAIREVFGWGEVRVSGGRIHIGADPSRPQVGDQRIRYELVPLGEISVVARQRGDGFAHYETEAGDALFMVSRGAVPAAAMFAEAVTANAVLTWVLRIVGLVLMAVGFGLALSLLGVLADVIPFLGSIVRAGTGLLATAMAVLVGSVVIAVAWFWYRPLLALGVLVAGAAIVWLIGRMAKRRNAEQAPA